MQVRIQRQYKVPEPTADPAEDQELEPDLLRDDEYPYYHIFGLQV